MLVVMFNKKGCNSFANCNKVVGSKVVVVGSSAVIVVGVTGDQCGQI